MIRIVIVEDQMMLRDSLATTISLQHDMQVAATLGDAENAQRDIR